MAKFLAAIAVIGISLALFGVANAGKPVPLTSSAVVDLERYMGRWWVIAHIPYFAEKGKVATADVYALKPDGDIDNVYVYRKRFGGPERRMQATARVYPGSNNNHWQVRFWGGLVRAQLLILEVSPDYRWALIGNPDRSMAWVFARDPVMSDARLAELTARFAAYGYDPAEIVRVPQTPDQLPASN